MNHEIIRFEEVNWIRKGKTIIENFHWSVRKGEHWVILGLNGSGKTSILNLLTGYSWKTSGHIEVFGHIYGQTYLQKIRKRIGIVSTSIDNRYQAKSYEIVKNIVRSGKYAEIGLHTPMDEEDEQQVSFYLEKFHLTPLSETPYAYLSQGERQRVMIARAFMARPELLILDEPCTGLDIYAREQLLKTLQSLQTLKNCPTIIYVTHHLEEILPFFTHVLLLHEGKVVASGKKEHVLTEENLEKTFQVPVSLHIENNRPYVTIK